jgi:hypothetical protein
MVLASYARAMANSEPPSSAVRLFKPPKRVNEMTSEERAAWAQQIYDVMVANRTKPEADASS